MKLLRLFALLFVPALSFAQFTTVTGTVIDPNGLAYANGTIVPTLVTSASPTLNGLAYTPPTQPVGLDINGKFAMQLADNTVLLPASTKWNFQVCSFGGTIQPAGGKGSVCFSLASPITISGSSQSISTQLQAAALPLSNNPGTGTVSSIAATAPITATPNPITGTGTIACPTCNAFSALTASTNTSAAMVVGSGATLSSTGTGVNIPTPFLFGQLFYITASTYGVICDGSAHAGNDAAFAAAVTAAQSLGNGAVVVPFGICITTNPVLITTSFVSLVGQYQEGSAIGNNTGGNDIVQITGASSGSPAQFNQVANLLLYHTVAGTGSSSGLKLTNVAEATITNVSSRDSIHDFNQVSGDRNITYRNCIPESNLGVVTDGYLIQSSSSTYIEDAQSIALSSGITNALNMTTGIRDLFAERFNVGASGGTVTVTGGAGVVTDIHFLNAILEPGGSTVAITLSNLTSSGGVQNQIEFIGTHIKTSSGNGATLSNVSGVQFIGGEITIPQNQTGVVVTGASSQGNTFLGTNFSCTTAPCTPMSFDNASNSNNVSNIVNNTGSNISDANGTNYNVFALAQADPTKYIWFFDDFLSMGATAVTSATYLSSSAANGGGAGPGVNWFFSNTGASSVVGQGTWDSGAYGVAVLTTGATSGNNAGLFFSSSGAFTGINATTFEIKIRAKLGQTTTIKYGGGYMDAVGDAASANFIGIAYDTVQSDTGWMCVTKSASTATRTAVAGTLDTNYHTLRIWSSTAGTVNCSVDEGATTTNSTNVPSATMNFGNIAQTAASAAENVHLDYVRLWEAVSRP